MTFRLSYLPAKTKRAWETGDERFNRIQQLVVFPCVSKVRFSFYVPRVYLRLPLGLSSISVGFSLGFHLNVSAFPVGFP